MSDNFKDTFKLHKCVCVCFGEGREQIGHLTGIRGLPTCFSLSNCLTTLTLFTPLVPPRLEPLEAAVGGLLPVTPNAISANSLIQRVTKSLLVWVFKGIKVLWRTGMVLQRNSTAVLWSLVISTARWGTKPNRKTKNAARKIHKFPSLPCKTRSLERSNPTSAKMGQMGLSPKRCSNSQRRDLAFNAKCKPST